VAAFLLPIAVFIAGLVVFEKVFAGVIDTKWLQTTLIFVLALSAAFVCILITKAINKRLNKN
jgi:lipopolysaccharide export LptBFGC system permease protein LptF